MIGGLVKNTLAKIATAAMAGAATALSTARVAFAAGIDTSLPPEYSEILRLAQQKVQAATQPGAFGNGIQLFFGADPMAIAPWLGIVAAAAITAVCAAKLLALKIESNVLLAQ